MNTIYQALADLESQGNAGVLCTGIKTRGSTPRKEGSKMPFYPDGEIAVSIMAEVIMVQRGGDGGSLSKNLMMTKDR